MQTATPASDPSTDTINWPALQLQDPQLAYVYDRLQAGTDAPTPEELAPQGEEVKILCSQFDRHGTL